jgi:hypothetical protein
MLKETGWIYDYGREKARVRGGIKNGRLTRDGSPYLRKG